MLEKNALLVTQMSDEDFVSSEMLEKKTTNRKVSVSGEKTIGYKQDKLNYAIIIHFHCL